VQTLHGHIGRVTGIGLSPDGRTLVTGDSTGETKFWDMRTSFEVFSVRRHSSAITTIEFSTNGRLLVTGGHGQLAIWDAR
jgi:WD40 repeat protein